MNIARLVLLVVLASVVLAPVIPGQKTREPLLDQAEKRLRAIYDRGEFRTRRFRADWLPDSSGYTVSERRRGSRQAGLVKVDAASGKRTVLSAEQRRQIVRPRRRSPDGPLCA